MKDTQSQVPEKVYNKTDGVLQLGKANVIQGGDIGFGFCPRCGYTVLGTRVNVCCPQCGHRFCPSCGV